MYEHLNRTGTFTNETEENDRDERKVNHNELCREKAKTLLLGLEPSVPGV